MKTASPALPKNSKLFLVLLLGTLSAFGPFVVDLYLPSLPILAQAFHSEPSMVQLTLTTAMLGLAIGQLIVGPISDKFGRKKPLLICLAVYIISTIGIIFSPNIEVMIALRIVQGLASAGGVVISRAVATDLYEGQEMTQFFALLMIVNGLAPIISPILGSFLLSVMSWQGIFGFLTVIGVVVMAVSTRLHESLASDKRLQVPIISTFGVFGKIFKNRLFMAFVAIQSLLMGGMFAYISSSPFIFQEVFGLSAIGFALCFGANGAALVVGANVGAKLQNRTALATGVFGFVLASFFTIIMLLLKLNWFSIEIGFFAMLGLMGLILPAISSLAMESERQYAGSASALLGFAPFFLGGIVSPLVGIGNIFVSTSAVIGVCAVLGLIIYLIIKGKIV